jgi:hypothetical protein
LNALFAYLGQGAFGRLNEEHQIEDLILKNGYLNRAE